MNLIGKPTNNKNISICFFVSLLVLAGIAESSSDKLDLSRMDSFGFHKVGSGTLSWLGFELYTATYYADISSEIIPDASFPGWEPGQRVALQINYHRKISNSQLISATQKIWKKMGVSLNEEDVYVNALHNIWPNVKKDDTLILIIDKEGKSVFYLNNHFLGEIEASEFSLAFISIWTAPESPNQDLRNALIGLDKNLSDG